MVTLDQIAAELCSMGLGITVSCHDTGKGMVWRCRIFPHDTDVTCGAGTSNRSSAHAVLMALKGLVHEE